MNVLVIGSGGREHAIVEALSRSPKSPKIYAAPGNAGIAQLAECVAIKDTEADKLLAFAQENSIDLTVVGPEAALAVGVVLVGIEADSAAAEGCGILYGIGRNRSFVYDGFGRGGRDGTRALFADFFRGYGKQTKAQSDDEQETDETLHIKSTPSG